MTRSNRQLAVFGGISVLIIVVGWFALIAPQRSDGAAAAARADAAQAALDNLKGIGNPHGPTKQPAIHTADLYTLDTALPSQADAPTLHRSPSGSEAGLSRSCRRRCRVSCSGEGLRGPPRSFLNQGD